MADASASSRTSPIKVDGVLGEHQYLASLRCPAGHQVTFFRLGSFSGEGRSKPIDCYLVSCPECKSEPVEVYFDMYHPGPSLDFDPSPDISGSGDGDALKSSPGKLSTTRSELSRLLKADFGLEVLLVAGDGSWDAPHKLAACSSAEAALSQAQAVRGLGKALKSFQRVTDWHSCEQGLADQVTSIESVQFTDDQIITETWRIYFDTRDVVGNSLDHVPVVAWKSSLSAVSFPFFLSWLHFDRTRKFMDEAGERFTSLEYSGPGATGEIIVYENTGKNSSIGAAADIQDIVRAKMSSDSSVEDPWDTQRLNGLLIKVLLIGKDLFYIAVPERTEPRIRFYLTIFDDPRTRTMAQEILEEVSMILKPRR